MCRVGTKMNSSIGSWFETDGKEIAADVLCLQEVDAQKTSPHGSRQFLALERLLSDTAYQNYYQVTSVRPGSMAPADIHNLVILSRWPNC